MSIEETGFGERLKQERLKTGLNQADFASACEVSAVSQGYYEQNRRKPSSDYFTKLITLNIDIFYVLTGKSLSANTDKVLYEQPTDALLMVVNLQDEYGRFSGEQLKSLLEYAYRYQMDEEGMRSFLDTARVINELQD